MGGGALENVLSGDKENVIVVLSSDETTTDAILAYISSIQNSLIARSVLNPSIRVVGSSRWARFRNIEKNLFFKLNLRYVTSYHADRGNQRVLNFDRRYIADFGSIPSLYAYRGYDVTKLFVGTVKLHGSNFVRYLNEAELPLLQTPSCRKLPAVSSRTANGHWYATITTIRSKSGSSRGAANLRADSKLTAGIAKIRRISCLRQTVARPCSPKAPASVPIRSRSRMSTGKTSSPRDRQADSEGTSFLRKNTASRQNRTETGRARPMTKPKRLP